MSLILLFALASAAPEAPPSPPLSGGAAIKAIKEAKPDRKICKIERFVGSHMSQRVCMTKMEWEAGTQNARDALQRMVLAKPNPNNGSN